jgi:branched-chain amino acid transport system ATP-binding protein
VQLELEHVSSGYGRSPVLHDVSLHVGEGEIVALIGANGAGKSTLLNTVMGLVATSAGSIRFDGRAIGQLPTPAIDGRLHQRRPALRGDGAGRAVRPVSDPA